MGWSMVVVSIFNLLVVNLCFAASDLLGQCVSKKRGARMRLSSGEAREQNLAEVVKEKAKQLANMYAFRLERKQVYYTQAALKQVGQEEEPEYRDIYGLRREREDRSLNKMKAHFLRNKRKAWFEAIEECEIADDEESRFLNDQLQGVYTKAAEEVFTTEPTDSQSKSTPEFSES